jgi:ketose-bisphosphate aldolase
MLSSADFVRIAWENGFVIPAFNVPYPNMIKPVIEAVVEADSMAFLEIAPIEWENFEAEGIQEIKEEFDRWTDGKHVRLHLDHIYVIDEAGNPADYRADIRCGLDVKYDSVMLDGSTLDLEGNIEATREVVGMAHAAGVPCEAELGAVLREGGGPMPSYEVLFKSGDGFTDVAAATRFVQETGCDWLSVSIGNIHGAVTQAMREQEKVAARLNLDHLETLKQATGIPLVLHGGSGISKELVLQAITRGIAKINVGFAIRRAYENELRDTGSVSKAQAATRKATLQVLCDLYEVSCTYGKYANV